MNFELFKMDIIEEHNSSFKISISDNENNSCFVYFSPISKELKYEDSNYLTQVLKLREFQLRKLLHNKRPSSYYIGFSLNFALHDGLPNPTLYDKNKLTVIDNTQNNFEVFKSDKKTQNIVELYTDGSFNHSKEIGAFAILIKSLNKETYIDKVRTKRKGNNLIELLAVLHGLEYLNDAKRIRIITDSQYVIKGATEWLPLWKLNYFVTANGTKAKNITDWKKLDKLMKNKYIEFEWVKSHSEHYENTICHNNAKSLMKLTNEKN
ncbi:MAG: ribonuclease HI [Bacteroidales bacterium]|nr:ribonuclease HI [Bacteroidales bacterium]